MKNWKDRIFWIVLLIGTVLLIWASVGLIKYPGYWELVTEAVKTYWWQYAIGIACYGYLYIVIYMKRW